MLLIEKKTGLIEYFDFGRYITPQPFGRVRSATTDHELFINFKAKIKHDTIINLDEILSFFATNPKLTHGEGRMVAAVCSYINYNKAKVYINNLQSDYLIPYGAFKRNASNCARFVTETLIYSIENSLCLKKLKRLKLFTPSPIGNVLSLKYFSKVFNVSEKGNISVSNSKKHTEILSSFLYRIKNHETNLIGNMTPKITKGLSNKAQWLPGIGAGAWFEIFKTENEDYYLFKRTSAFETVDTENLFKINNSNFNVLKPYCFTYMSNCNQVVIIQNSIEYFFKNTTNSIQKVHTI